MTRFTKLEGGPYLLRCTPIHIPDPQCSPFSSDDPAAVQVTPQSPKATSNRNNVGAGWVCVRDQTPPVHGN